MRATASAAVVVLLVGGGFKLLGGSTKEVDPPSRASASAAPAAVVGAAGDSPGLTAGPVALADGGDGLSLSVPLHNGDGTALVVRGVEGLPAGMAPQLPTSGLRVPGHGDATLRLRWTGPDCDRARPDPAVGDLTWTGSQGSATHGALPSGTLDDVASDTWLDTCAGRPSEGGVPRG
ncbi:hypothetical protein CLV35_1826 [Motilibacter peucedani]|uniref:Uncharacterized protein n=1 Tax=Motilibacter peucedani TaxID=598650 RepID=A0A420XQ05_9ACTN|nr:hypothetical protein CLV35_1826 [Motilibacter peucedani]